MLILLCLCLVCVTLGAPPCRFAHTFETEELLRSSVAQHKYKEYVAYWENGFHQEGIGYSAANGFSFDGHGLDYTTGDIAAPLHNFSAPSKEAMHVGMLALALQGNPLAQLFVNQTGGSAAVKLAMKILEKKMDAYEAFNRKYPGYGGYIPWVSVSNTDPSIRPTPDWIGRVPSLDSGEWAWSLYAVSIAHQDCKECNLINPTLGKRYRAYFDLMAKTSVMMFYDGEGKVRAEAKIKDIYAQPTPSNYENGAANYYLDDPYEGELFVWIMDLYGHWDKPDEKEKIWDVKQKKLEAVNYTSPVDGKNITVQRGYWFSAHEQWKYLELPYLDVPLHLRLFRNCERARVQNSADHNIPGLFASVSNWTTSGPVAQYFGAVGIPSIAFNPSVTQDLLTPYGSMCLMLVEPAVGLAWHHNMLLMPRMQGPHGTTESMSVDGKWISPVVTWDSKITTLLAMSGGIGPINRQGLKADGVYDRFTQVLHDRWAEEFSNLSGEDLPFALPPPAVRPEGVPDFTLCH